ncbi:MAG TPA: hypothetical protein VLT34_07250 [Arthrobacter sp.]|nr:hypothetical protein [Arthrobacter sp.]
MGMGDNIRRSAEDALRDLAGLSEPADDAHVPEPGDPGDEIKVHSSISEGSNSGDVPGDGPDRAPDPQQAPAQEPGRGTSGNDLPGDGTVSGDEPAGAREADDGHPRGVPGPAGLPEPDPNGLRADPSEGEGDPSASMGRG